MFLSLTLGMLNEGLERADAKTKKAILEQIRDLSATIKKQRQKMGFTQESLAEALDISVNTIKYIEQGRRLPSLVMILKISIALKLKITIQKA